MTPTTVTSRKVASGTGARKLSRGSRRITFVARSYGRGEASLLEGAGEQATRSTFSCSPNHLVSSSSPAACDLALPPAHHQPGSNHTHGSDHPRLRDQRHRDEVPAGAQPAAEGDVAGVVDR